MALTASPYGYSVFDPTDAWVQTNSALDAANDDIARNESEQKNWWAKGWKDTVGWALEETRQAFTGNTQVPGPFIVDPDGDAVAGDAHADGDNIIFGNNAGSGNKFGITGVTDGAGEVGFFATDVAGQKRAGFYTLFADDSARIRVANGDVMQYFATVVRPAADNSVSWGQSVRRWSDLHTMTGTVYGDLTLSGANPELALGVGTGGPDIILDKSDTSTSIINWKNAGTTRWQLWHFSDESLYWRRYDAAGVFVDNMVTFATGGDVFMANDLALNSASPTLTVGNGTDSPVTDWDKSAGGSSSLRWAIAGSVTTQGAMRCIHDSSEDLVWDRRNGGGAYDEWLKVSGDATSVHLGFFGASPVPQQSTTGTTTGFTAGSGTGVNDDSTFTGNTGSSGYTIGDIVLALKNYGLLAA